MNTDCPLRSAARLAESGCPAALIEEILAITFRLGFDEARAVAADAAFERRGQYTGWVCTS